MAVRPVMPQRGLAIVQQLPGFIDHDETQLRGAFRFAGTPQQLQQHREFAVAINRIHGGLT